MLQNDFERLLDWYRRNKRDLPWRRTLEPYPVLVSEMMLQQTTVAAVVPKFQAWMERFPDLETLARATPDAVLHQWSGLGYYQRAKRLHQAARQIVAAGGQVPQEYEELLKLPGFGPYTAAAVASICFERPHLAVDTNVARVLYRYYAVRKSAGDPAVHRELRRRVAQLLSRDHPGEFNQALMELGAGHCSVKAVECDRCPLRAGCAGRRAATGPLSFPQAGSRKMPEETPGQALVLEALESGAVLLVRGTSLGLLGELHQPPIHFAAGAAGSMAGASEALLRALAPHPTEREWRLNYGISGRKLRLLCSHWCLAGATVERLRQGLTSHGIRHLMWRPEDREDQSAPLSTLTRKILRKWRENP